MRYGATPRIDHDYRMSTHSIRVVAGPVYTMTDMVVDNAMNSQGNGVI